MCIRDSSSGCIKTITETSTTLGLYYGLATPFPNRSFFNTCLVREIAVSLGLAHQNLYELAAQVGVALRTRNRMLAIAESCTGGWISKVVTDVSGSSGWFDRGFVTYSNAFFCLLYTSRCV